MKEYDIVEVIKDRAEYAKRGIHKGDIGTIMSEERNGYILVYFDGEIFQDEDGVYSTSDIDIGMRTDDLKVVKEYYPRQSYGSDKVN